LIALAGLATASLFAQEFRGTFSGSVTDTKGAAVPQARIVAIETRTGAKSEANSDTPGGFSLGGAPSGTNELLYNVAPNAGYTNQMAYSPPQEVPNTTPTSSTFGTVSTQANSPRALQLAARVVW